MSIRDYTHSTYKYDNYRFTYYYVINYIIVFYCFRIQQFVMTHIFPLRYLCHYKMH